MKKEISITILHRTETHYLTMPARSSVYAALEHLKIPHTTVITVRNKTVIPESTTLNDNDVLELINVLSGG